jgi:type IV pilus assembly protein PilW
MSGMSLVEVLVALVIGMLATIVVLQLFTDSESRNRTSSGSADAQSNGLMTLYQMQSNIQRAGYGINSTSLFNCNATWKVSSGNAITTPATLAPVAINPKDAANALKIPAGDDNTDVLVVMFGNGNSEPEGNEILDTTGNVYTVRSQSLFAEGDRVISAPFSTSLGGLACGTTSLSIDRVNTIDSATSKVTAEVGTAGKILFNLGPGPKGPNASPTAAMPTNGPTILVYAIRSGSLTVCDFSIDDCSKDSNKKLVSVWVPIASNIVSMRAVYWWDDSPGWSAAAPTDPTSQPTTACEWARVKAINLALVARSDEKDKGIVTTTTINTNKSETANAPSWSQVAAAPLVAASGALGPDKVADEEWKHYRYKTFQAFIPLRNVTWMGSPPTGCS